MGARAVNNNNSSSRRVEGAGRPQPQAPELSGAEQDSSHCEGRQGPPVLHGRRVALALKKKLIKVKLEALERSDAASWSLPGCGPGYSSDRTRSSVVNGLKKKLKDSMDSFNNLRQQISSEYRETVQRRYFTITGENPDEKTFDILISTVTVPSTTSGGDGRLIFKASLCCKDRSDLIVAADKDHSIESIHFLQNALKSLKFKWGWALVGNSDIHHIQKTMEPVDFLGLEEEEKKKDGNRGRSKHGENNE
ncbi:syntaxin-121-like [Senna tora]|uniref:Syntaxin-121-like n=1 Tax=Senna tora TaxID=362788 RepID=A0A834WCN6_9FABA|nr:syntaxin-121-like [Senna tora]